MIVHTLYDIHSHVNQLTTISNTLSSTYLNTYTMINYLLLSRRKVMYIVMYIVMYTSINPKYILQNIV